MSVHVDIEPDSDEQLRGILLELSAVEAADCIGVLRRLCGRVREHERLVLRERPTRPDLVVVPER